MIYLLLVTLRLLQLPSLQKYVDTPYGNFILALHPALLWLNLVKETI